MQDDRFEWDDRKAARNKREHRVTFELACAAFDDPNGVVDADDEPDEQRRQLIGMAIGRLLLVVYTERIIDMDGLSPPRIRIISARKANRHEQERYLRQEN